MTSLKNLSQFKKLGNQVTSISSSLYRYTGMGHGILSRIYHIWEVRFHVKKLAEDQAATFIKGKALRLTLFGTFFFSTPARKCRCLASYVRCSHYYTTFEPLLFHHNLGDVSPEDPKGNRLD